MGQSEDNTIEAIDIDTGSYWDDISAIETQQDVNVGTESDPVQDGGNQPELTNETDSLFRKFLMF